MLTHCHAQKWLPWQLAAGILIPPLPYTWPLSAAVCLLVVFNPGHEYSQEVQIYLSRMTYIIFAHKFQMKKILGHLYVISIHGSSKKLKMLINAEENDFILFGTIELKRSTLIDVSFKLYQRIFVSHICNWKMFLSWFHQFSDILCCYWECQLIILIPYLQPLIYDKSLNTRLCFIPW